MKKNILLIGMMGCGKSTIGKKLAKEIGYFFIDMDEFIEKEENKSISQMFLIGEDYFREAEKKASKKLSTLEKTVISTGGGVILNHENMECLRKNSYVIFIERDICDIVSKVDISKRPLLKKDPNKIYEIYEKRYPLYEKYKDIKVKNNNISECTTDIINKLTNKEIL